RIVYLNDACIYALNSYLPIRMDIRDVNPRDRNALFISGKKNRISTETVKWLVKKYCALSGLDPKISAHKLRHTSATLMYKNGVDLRALQEILGHKHLNTTEIYTHVDSDDLRVAARANPLSTVRKKSEPSD
ncbi:MAG: tyrosine-type recombinase/integrase, partial [Clostridia bacterium]